jgi:hypothetical protein
VVGRIVEQNACGHRPVVCGSDREFVLWRSWSSEALTKMSQEAAGNLPPDQWWVPED